MISIIIPVYNTANYLRQCIDCILSQSFTDWECILIDDDSTDDSLQICEEYAEKDVRIKVFCQNHLGVSAARNKGIKEATGEWITFVDSDDYLFPNYLSSFSLEYDVSLQGYVKGSVPITYPECIISEQVGANYINNGYLLGPVCKLFNSRIIKDNELKFDEKLSYGEDVLFNLYYLSYCQSLYVSHNSGYYYRQHSPNTLSRRKKKYDELYDMYQKHYVIYSHLLKSFPNGKKIQNRYTYEMILHFVNGYNIRYSHIQKDAFLYSSYCKLALFQRLIIKFFPQYSVSLDRLIRRIERIIFKRT